MNAKTVALCSIFVAIAIILDRVRIPLGVISFYFWEIPIVIALLLFGLKFGFSVAAISVFAQAIIFPRAMGFLFPVWNLIAMSTTMVAMAVTYWFLRRSKFSTQDKKYRIKPLVYFVSTAIVLRLSIMPFVNYFMYKFMIPLVLDRNYTDAVLMVLIPSLLIYDLVLILYTVPTSYIIAKKVNKNLKVGKTIF